MLGRRSICTGVGLVVLILWMAAISNPRVHLLSLTILAMGISNMLSA